MPIYSNFKFLLHKPGCGVSKVVLFYNGFLRILYAFNCRFITESCIINDLSYGAY